MKPKLKIELDGYWEKDGKIQAVFIKPTLWLVDKVDVPEEMKDKSLTQDERIAFLEKLLNEKE